VRRVADVCHCAGWLADRLADSKQVGVRVVVTAATSLDGLRAASLVVSWAPVTAEAPTRADWWLGLVELTRAVLIQSSRRLSWPSRRCGYTNRQPAATR
jgi:hypothetical protein